MKADDNYGRSPKAAKIIVAIAAVLAVAMLWDMNRKMAPTPKRGDISPQYEIIMPA